MEAMRQSWTDDRLDDLSQRMDERFDHVEREMDRRFGEVDKRFDRVATDIRDLRNKMNALQRTMLQVGGGLIAANLTLMAAVIGLMVTQL